MALSYYAEMCAGAEEREVALQQWINERMRAISELFTAAAADAPDRPSIHFGRRHDGVGTFFYMDMRDFGLAGWSTSHAAMRLLGRLRVRLHLRVPCRLQPR